MARIWRNVGGTYTLLGQMSAPASSGLLRFEVSGTSLKLFLNGSQLLSVNDSALTTGTVGIRAAGGATIDTFTVI